MIQRDRLELLLAAVAGAGLGGVAGIVLGHEELGTLIWALVGAAVVSGVVYFYWSFRRHYLMPSSPRRFPAQRHGDARHRRILQCVKPSQCSR